MGFACFRAQALGCESFSSCGVPVAPWNVGSSRNRGRTCVLCSRNRILTTGVPEKSHFIPFLWLNNILLHVQMDGPHLFIHSSADGLLSCFHILDTVNSVATTICVQVFV